MELQATNTNPLEELKGAFVSSLIRNNTKIKQDRAIAIAESAEMTYKRKVEDLTLEIKQLRRDRESMLDMSAKDTTSLILASDFDSTVFVNKDIEIGLRIRNLEIQLEIAVTRYNQLFTENKS